MPHISSGLFLIHALCTMHYALVAQLKKNERNQTKISAVASIGTSTLILITYFVTRLLLLMEILTELHVINSWVGLVHTLFAIIAMIFGIMIFLNRKGTKKHRIYGYIYVFAMLALNISSFCIYNFGAISMFHFFALISLITIAFGLIPAIKRTKNWLRRHFYFMSWSVVGLYCAFWAEIGVRFFDMKYFWWVVMLATCLTSLVGAKIINKEAAKRSFS